MKYSRLEAAGRYFLHYYHAVLVFDLAIIFFFAFYGPVKLAEPHDSILFFLIFIPIVTAIVVGGVFILIVCRAARRLSITTSWKQAKLLFLMLLPFFGIKTYRNFIEDYRTVSKEPQ